jgi:23S rRNA (cytidine1920-2'-O)/16S rRNA (cytidine1409-2'-O)-methyltransferase
LALKSKNKTRLDILMMDKGLVQSRQRAKALIMAGSVKVNDLRVDKPGTLVPKDINIAVKSDVNPYVSRGGLKLEKALQTAAISVKGMICLDIGASTGGFTDCLLQHGAIRVYAVDVGYGQLDWKLRQDKRVIVIERSNIRYLPFESLNEKVDIVVADTSFISLKLVIPASEKFMKENALVLALIKPQFEAGKQNVGKGGVVRNPEIREQVIQDIEQFFTDRGYLINFVVPSPISGPKGNIEYMISLSYSQI